jgi:aryl-alcohol dehydrogenase-like predicted oxidoreductase
VVLATKVYGAIKRESVRAEPNTDGRGLSAYKIRKHCEASLKRLQTDHIDLYQMHHVDRDCPWDEIWQAFAQLGNQGKVVYVGSSNFAGWDIATACQEASKRGLTGLSSEQSIYHLSNRTVELEVIPACKYYGLGLIPWSPLGGGLLGGILEKLQAGRRTDDETRKEIDKHRSKLEKRLCANGGEPPAPSPGLALESRRDRSSRTSNRRATRLSCALPKSRWTSERSPSLTKSSRPRRRSTRPTPGNPNENSIMEK